MKKKMEFLLGIWLLFFVLAANGRAQEGLTPEAEILSVSEKVVKGTPFSAEAVSESVQIMFDGNKITRNVKSILYRDGEGRFRREEMPKPVGIGSFVEMPRSIFIFDPVAGFKFFLDSKSKTFRQSIFKDDIEIRKQEIEKRALTLQEQGKKILADRQPKNKSEQLEIENELRKIERQLKLIENELRQLEKDKRTPEKQQGDGKPPLLGKKPKGANKSENAVSANSGATTEQSAQASITINGVAQTKSSGIKAAGQPQTAAEPNKPNNPSIPVLPGGKEKKESLGKRIIEGIEAEGTRLTKIIAAGAIGNEREFEIVYERWYSEDLQLLVFSKYSDPRFGEQTYRLTNIKLVEPDTELFKVPADFKINNNKQWKIQDKPRGNREKRLEPTKRKP